MTNSITLSLCKIKDLTKDMTLNYKSTFISKGKKKQGFITCLRYIAINSHTSFEILTTF